MSGHLHAPAAESLGEEIPAPILWAVWVPQSGRGNGKNLSV